MQFQCPKCSGVVRIDAANLGKTVSCGHCKEIVNAPADRFAPGVIINDFLIEKEVGVGGMGIVYLAKQITLDRPVALKILKEKYASDSDFIVQFVKEARAAAKLNHYSIVQAYAVGEEEGIFFFAMEFVDGRTMKEILADEKKIEPARAAKIIRDIADALDYAWTESRIVHHDIKPDNIMLTKNNKAKLADLGLAGIFGEASAADDEDEVLGTPQYISPEQLLGDPTDVRSDIYSLGATFYHLVTGTFPYNGDTATEIAHKHVNGTYEPPIKREPSLPVVLSDIIGKMMSRDINERYQNAADVVNDLQKYLSDNGQVSTNTTASVPIQTVSARPAGGLKLSLNRGGAGAAKAKAQNEKPTASAPAAAPSAAPAVNTSAPAKPVPTLNKPAAVSGAVPKVNVPTLTTPTLQKPGAPAVEAPKIGLKKPEVKAPEIKAPEAKEDAPKAEEQTEKTAEVQEKSPKKKGKKSDNSADGKKKKSKKFEEKKKLPVGLIILAVIILAAAGGVTYYLYKNNWKAPVWEKFVAWNKERKEKAKNIVRRIPVKPKKEPTIQELRKNYNVEAEELKKFIAANPSQGKSFMEKVDAFNEKWGMPELENEHKPYQELTALYNQYDEKVWCAPNRAALKNAHQREINRRVQQEKAKLAEEARIQAERKAAAARIAAHQKAEAERRRKEEEEKRKAVQKTQEYRRKIAPAYPRFAKLFYDAIFSETKAAEFQRAADNIFNDYTPDDGVQMALFEQAKSYVQKLQGILSHARKAYTFITENNSKFCSHILVLPRLGQVEIIAVDFPNHKITVQAIISQKKSVISLDNAAMRDRFFKLFNRKIEGGDGISYLPFYYELFFGKVRNAAKHEAPSADWKEFFKYYR